MPMTDPAASAWPGEPPLPCPFCGGPGKMIHPMGGWVSKEIGYGPDGSRIICSGCGVHTAACYGPDQDAEAIAVWNCRPPADLATTAREHEAGGDARVIAMREAILTAVEGERVEVIHDEEDRAYNRALDHSLEAIRALPLPPTEALTGVVAEAVAKTLADEVLLRKTLDALDASRAARVWDDVEKCWVHARGSRAEGSGS